MTKYKLSNLIAQEIQDRLAAFAKSNQKSKGAEKLNNDKVMPASKPSKLKDGMPRELSDSLFSSEIPKSLQDIYKDILNKNKSNKKKKKTKKVVRNSKNQVYNMPLPPNMVKSLFKAIPGLTLEKVKKFLGINNITKYTILHDMQVSIIYKSAMKDPGLIKTIKQSSNSSTHDAPTTADTGRNKKKEKSQWVSFVSIPFGGMNKRY